MKRTGNINNISGEFTWSDKTGLTTKELGRSTGSHKLYANLDSVPPGSFSTKYHSHTQQEEFFYILSGTGTLRINGKEEIVNTGDFLSKPAGQKIAHTFYNPGSEPLLILDVGTVEPEDTCYYPDEDMYMHKSPEGRTFYRGNDLAEDWNVYPND